MVREVAGLVVMLRRRGVKGTVRVVVVVVVVVHRHEVRGCVRVARVGRHDAAQLEMLLLLLLRLLVLRMILHCSKGLERKGKGEVC